jgi:hypothetical protein
MTGVVRTMSPIEENRMIRNFISTIGKSTYVHEDIEQVSFLLFRLIEKEAKRSRL